MIEIPTEIWIHIASYLPNETLRQLYSVNRVFFDISMNARWKEVVLNTRTVAESKRMFKRLSDPFIAGRVRTLGLLCGQGEGESHIRHTGRPSATLFRFKDHLDILASAIQGHSDPVLDFIRKVLVIGPKMVNIDHLDINLSELHPRYDLRRLCKTFWASFGANLRCLTLGGSVKGYCTIMESSPILPALYELQLEFTSNISHETPDELTADNVAAGEKLVSFVNSLSPHLEGLRIWSWATDLDLSPFFSGLALFPKLRYLGVRMSFDKALQRDASGLKDLLLNHSTTLQRIELRLHSSRFHLDTNAEDSVCHWLLQCLADERCFSQVRSLDFYTTTTREGKEIILTTVKRVSKTLTRLTLRDRYLQHEEALSVIDAASECAHLKFLRMNIYNFNIGFLDHMAAKLPNLEVLWIAIGLGDHTDNPNDFTTLGLEFTEALKARSYDKWRLKDLSVWQSGAEIDLDAMRSLAASIPSLESFFDGEVYLTEALVSTA